MQREGCDFVRMSPPLEGIYVANYYDSEGGLLNPNTPLRTTISFDMGGEWNNWFHQL